MSDSTKRKPYIRALILGVLSIASYIVLFTHADLVMDNFIKGGLYALLPIITALYFSVLHGSFASTVLNVFGVRPKGH